MPRRDDSGSGALSTLVGVAMVLLLLLLCVQVLVHLYATSAVTAAAYDAARLASGTAAVSPDAASAHGRSVLGRFSDDVTTFDVTVEGDAVRVRVVGTSPALLPAALSRATGIASIDRTVVVRREGLVCDGC